MINLNKEIEMLEEIQTGLFCTKMDLGSNTIRYSDELLKDMYDHNFFKCKELTSEIFSKALEYAKKNNEGHIKFITEKDCSEIGGLYGLEAETELTMYKSDFDFGNKKCDNLIFKNVKNDGIEDDITALEIKEFGEIYGLDFCKRKCKRIYDVVKRKDNDFNFYGAYLGDKLVGFCSLMVGENLIGLDDLVTASEYRHKGIATTLMRYISNTLKKPMFLHADLDDTPKDMYKDLGFKEIKRIYTLLNNKLN